MLNTIDLFSGVGGITLGLRGYTKPLLYCDVDSACRAVLQARMDSHDLPSARICPDVRVLDKSWLRETDAPVDMIVGGFPCVGFSALGLLGGFDDDQSGLFREVVRLVDLFEPPLVFMENVYNIVALGLKEVCETFAARGYELRWCTIPATAIGALHERKRWFCLAVKEGHSLDALRDRVSAGGEATDFPELLVDWSADGPDRMIPKPRNDDGGEGEGEGDGESDSTGEGSTGSSGSPASRTGRPDISHRARCGMMGNAVVPDCVRTAFNYLVRLPLRGKQVAGSADMPTCGYMTLKKEAEQEQADSATYTVFKWGKMPWDGIRADRAKSLCFDPSAFVSPKEPSRQLTAKRLEKPKLARIWATPRHGMVGACNFLTERSVRDLPTQVRFERDTPDHLRGGIINPEFVEWLMGYPAGWTTLAVPR